MYIEIKDKDEETRKYYPVPAIVEGDYYYEDVNKNVELRKNVTRFFYRKVFKWIENDDQFIKLKTIKPLLEKNGKKYIYSILRRFIKKSKLNWYNLKEEYKYIKKYMYNKLSKLK